MIRWLQAVLSFLQIENEEKAIRQIFQWYTEEGYGGAKIANMLNERGIKTKGGNN